MRECGTNIGGRTVTVVGQRLAQERNASRTVAFIHNSFVISSVFASAKSLVDCGFDLVLWQRIGLCLFNSGRQRSVVFGIGVAAFARGNGNVTGEFGEQRGALCVLSKLAVLRGSPLRMS